MAKSESAQVIDLDGVRGTLEQGSPERDSAASLLVQLEGGERLLVPRGLLTEQEDGSYRLETRLAALLKSQSEEVLRIPVIEETVQVQRVETTGKVAVTKTVQERIEHIDEPLFSEEVTVERITVNRPVEQPPAIRHEGDTLVIPLLEEMLVVEKRLVLREEVHIRKLRTEVHSPQEVSLRSEQIAITRHPISSLPASPADEQKADEQST